MSGLRRQLLAIWLVASVPGAAGCAAAGGPGFETVSVRSAEGVVEAGEVHPLRAGTWTYEVTAGDDRGTVIRRHRSRTDRYGAEWVERDGGRRSRFWRTDGDGNLVMPAVIDHDRDSLTFFEPPLVVAWAELAAGKPRSQELRMRAMDADDPQRLRDSGTATSTIEYVEDAVLRTPLGLVPVRRIDVRFSGDLRLADVETQATLYVGAGLGPIVVQRRENLRMLGLFGSEERQTLVLTDGPEAEPPDAAGPPP